MSETSQLEAAVIELIRGAMSNAEQAKQFVIGEAPEVVQQLIYWELISNSISGTVGLTICIVFFLLGFRSVQRSVDNIKRLEETPKEDWPLWAFCNSNPRTSATSSRYVTENWTASTRFSFLYIGIMPGLLFLPDYMVAIKIGIAPKIYLLEYAADLIK